MVIRRMEFAQQIKAFRTAHGFTQKALADQLGLTATAIHSWENGTRPWKKNKNEVDALMAIYAVAPSDTPAPTVNVQPPRSQYAQIVEWLYTHAAGAADTQGVIEYRRQLLDFLKEIGIT